MLLPTLSLLLLAVSRDTTAPPRTRWAVVTGASSGIGRAIALELSRQGYSLVLHGRRRDALDAVAITIRTSAAVDTKNVACDLTAAKCVDRLDRETRALPVEVLVANAGFAHVGAAVLTPEKSAAEMLAVKAGSPARLARVFGRRFVASRTRGAILFTSSLTALAPLPGAALYGALNAYLLSYAPALRSELQSAGITVMCLLPGVTDTGFAAVANMSAALAFSAPFARTLGLVMSADAVAADAVDALLGRGRSPVAAALGMRAPSTIIPGLLNRAYARAVTLLPRDLGAEIAALFFDPRRSPLRSARALLRAAPTLAVGGASVLVCAAFEIVVGDTWLTSSIALALLLAAIRANRRYLRF